MADEPMSKAQSEQFQHNLQKLSEAHVQEQYQKAYADCALSHGRVPTPVEIQRLLVHLEGAASMDDAAQG